MWKQRAREAKNSPSQILGRPAQKHELTFFAVNANISIMTLDEWLTTNNVSTRDFADRIGVDNATCWRLRNQRTRPQWTTLKTIIEKTNGAVMPNDFLSDEPLGVSEQSGDAA